MDHRNERLHGVTELAYFPLEGVDALGVVDAGSREHLVLEPVEGGAHPSGRVAVRIDGDVQHGVDHSPGAMAQHVRIGVQSTGGLGAGIDRSVAHGENTAGSYEDHDVAGLHRRFFFDISQGLQRDGQDVAEALAFRTLPPVHSVFDGQRVKAQFLGQLDQFTHRGTCQPDPGEVVLAHVPQPLEGGLAGIVRQLALHMLRPARVPVVYDTFHLPRMLHPLHFMRPQAHPVVGHHVAQDTGPIRVCTRTRVVAES